MIKGIYTSASGMRPRSERLEIIANNLANINTTGFKRDNAFVMALSEASAVPQVGKGNLVGLKMHEFTDFSEGSFNQTNNTFDVALQGDGFFVVETPGGVRYTRNGNFTLAADGTLITNEGYSVMGTSGKLRLNNLQRSQIQNVNISERGEVTLDKTVVGRLQVVRFNDNNLLKKEGHSFFVPRTGAQSSDVESSTTKVRQGYLEESNVDGIFEMVALIELSRSFETEQKSIQQQDATLEKANEVGRM